MGFVKKIKARIRSEPDKSMSVQWVPPQELYSLCSNGYTPLSRQPDVKLCVKKIADLVSTMTIYQMQNTDIGNKRIKDGLSYRVDIAPSPYLTRKTLIYKCVEELLIHGNSVLMPIHNQSTGHLEELKPVYNADASLYPLSDGSYSVKIGGVDFSYDEVVHFVNNPSRERPWEGQGYRVHLQDVIKNLKLSNVIKSDFYTQHYRPGLIFTFAGDSDIFASEDARKKIFDKWIKVRRGQPHVLPGGLIDVKEVRAMSLKDIAINENVEIDKKFIAALFGVPPFVLGVGKYNVDEYNNFVDTAINPIAEIISQELTKKLLFATDRFFKFNLESLKAFDMDTRINRMYNGKAMGIFNADEIRIAAGYEPTGLPEMREYTMLENYIKVKDTGRQKKLVQDDKPEEGE